MKVKVANRMYSMSKKEFQNLLEVAREQVPFGIYAVEKNGYAEMRNDRVTSITNLKTMIRDFKAAGYKVYANKE